MTEWSGARGCCGDTVTGESGGHDEKLRWELALAAGVKAGVWEVVQERLYKAVGGRMRREVGVIEQHEAAQVELLTTPTPVITIHTFYFGL